MKKNFIIYFLLILIPYVILLPYTIKFFEVGNDFELYFFTYKKYIFELLNLGHFPLWSPVEASGSSLIFNPLTQYFYLPSWVFYSICFVIGDISKYSFLIFTISAISIFNLGLFLYFRSLKIDIDIAITTIIITCLSLKINELLRFPNAIHSFAWFPWILYGINLASYDASFKKSFLVIFFSTLMLLTAGYPYYIFYGFIVCVIYFIFLTITPIKKNIFNLEGKNIINLNFFLRCSIPSVLSILIISPWLLKISQLVSITHGRNNTSVSFSHNVASNVYDQIGSWIYPPFSIAEGWYYFGAMAVLIIAVIFLYNISFNIKNFKNNYPINFFSIFLIFLIIISYQISNPIDSLIFETLWNNLEFIQNFRHFVRFNVVLVPFISLLLAYSINQLILFLSSEKNNLNQLIFIFICSFLLIFTTQSYFIFFSDYENGFWNTWQLKRIISAEDNLPFALSFIAGLYKNFIYPIFFIISFIILVAIIKNKKLNSYFNENKKYFLSIIVTISFFELFFLTNIQWAIPFNYYNEGYLELKLEPNYNRKNINAMRDLNDAFEKSSTSLEKSGNNNYEGNTYYRNNKSFNINHINNWGNDNHVKLFKKYFHTNGQMRANLKDISKKNIKLFFGLDSSAKRIFFSKNLKYPDINEFILNSNLDEINSSFEYEKIYYNGDKLSLKVNSYESGWITFIDTWDHNWKVYVNGEERMLSKLFDAYKSVNINAGNSTVEFIYKPFNFDFYK